MNKEMARKPDWAHRASHMSHKPDWVDKIPRQLWELNKVFFPIPRRKKGWNYPHHVDRFRFEPDDEIFNAYMESGWGYGVACDGALIVLDIDDKDFVDEIIEHLPPTVYQWTGSGDGIHLFYLCEGVNRRKTFKDVTWVCPECGSYRVWYEEGKDKCEHCDWEQVQSHIGEMKADPNGYVVGPGSIHPSGNEYGPLQGDEIATVDRETIEYAIMPYLNVDYRRKGSSSRSSEPSDYSSYGSSSPHNFYKLTADDVLPWLSESDRIAHPIHGSSTGTNFMKNGDSDTFVCWRCQCGLRDGCVINAQHLLAMMEHPDKYGKYACEEVRRNWRNDSTLHYHAWKQAVRKGLITMENIPYTVIRGFLVETGAMDESERIPWSHSASEQLKYEMQAELRDEVVGRWEK